MIPFFLGQQLFNIATGPKQFFAVEGEIHEGALMALGVEQTQQLREFLFKKINRSGSFDDWVCVSPAGRMDYPAENNKSVLLAHLEDCQ